MTAPGEMLMQPDRVRGAFLAALGMHAAIIGGLIYSSWLASHRDSLGAPNAGGTAVAIEAVSAIPLSHTGPENPLASDTDSIVPQAPKTKAVDRVKEEKPPPDAVPIKSPKQKKAEDATEKNNFRPYSKVDPYQVYSKSAPAVSSPVFAAKGAGNVGAGPNSTLGNHCPAYAAQIQQLMASHWNTSSIDASLRVGTVIATFDLAHDGSVRNVRLLQRSGIDPLDSSVERAIQDSNPLPAIQRECGVDHASAEFWFELKR